MIRSQGYGDWLAGGVRERDAARMVVWFLSRVTEWKWCHQPIQETQGGTGREGDSKWCCDWVAGEWQQQWKKGREVRVDSP